MTGVVQRERQRRAMDARWAQLIAEGLIPAEARTGAPLVLWLAGLVIPRGSWPKLRGEVEPHARIGVRVSEAAP